jgi:signal peptidase I
MTSTLAAALAIGAAAAARSALRRYAVVESSMVPALLAGDYVMARAARSAPHRGDIVVFEHPTQPGFELVKRVVGLPGESLTISNGQVHVGGRVLPEPWADGPTRPDGHWDLGPHIFVLGDARAVSVADGRTLGPLPVEAARWRVQFRYWPPGRIGPVGRG